MKRYARYARYALLLLVILVSSCKKEIIDKPVIEFERQPGNIIYYSTIDDKPLLLTDVNAFSSPYIATYYQDGKGAFIFTEDVKTINAGTFAKCDALKSIELPSSLKVIGDDAFSDCVNLESVSFPNGCSVETIGKRAFAHDGKMAGFTFPDCLMVVDDYAFEGCVNVPESNVKLSNKVTKIGHRIFDGCGDIRYVAPDFGPYSYPEVCEDSFETGNLLLLKVSYDRYLDYKAKLAPIAHHLFLSDGINNVEGSNWTEYMPESMPLNLLTVPGCHDAATWMCKWLPYFPQAIKKDQNLNYKECWGYGARLFDMRLGYDNNDTGADFKDRCCFYHGNQTDYFCKCNTFEEDINNYFPDPSWVDKSFLILEAQLENNDEPEKNLNIFEYFMRLLIEKYGADRFIEYHPDITLGDIKGKILLFATTRDFTKDYYYIGHTPQVPVNYREGGNIETFVNGTPTGRKYPIEVQNVYEVAKSSDKYNAIREGLKKPVGNLFFNGFNATNISMDYPYSWPISRYINRDISNDLAKSPVEDIYKRPLGLVYFDFCGVESKFLMVTYDFAGETLARKLVEQNFKEIY